MKASELTLNPRSWFKRAPALETLPRPWMGSLAGMPGVSSLRAEGADLHVTPTRDFAGRAVANLLSPEVDGYRLVIAGNPGRLEPREGLAYLRGLSDVKEPTLTDGRLSARVSGVKTADFYNNVLGNPRGLDEPIHFSVEYEKDTYGPYWRD